jgi:hypothetical protein
VAVGNSGEISVRYQMRLYFVSVSWYLTLYLLLYCLCSFRVLQGCFTDCETKAGPVLQKKKRTKWLGSSGIHFLDNNVAVAYSRPHCQLLWPVNPSVCRDFS